MKKTRVVAVIFGVCLGLSLVGGSAWADNWSWDTGVQMVNSQQLSGVSDPMSLCNGPSETMPINEVAQPQSVCLTQKTPSVETGSYQNLTAIRFGHDIMAYSLYGCQPSTCMYDPAQDVVITTQAIINPSSRSLVIYKHAAQRLEKASSINVNDGYAFDLSNPDYVDWDHSGYPLIVNALGLSANGRWLAMEFVNSGFGVMDLQTMTMEKVAVASYYYGQGSDPSINLAVSNDGGLIAVSGFNASDFMIEVTPGCGFDPVALPMTAPTTCTTIGLDDTLRGVQDGFLYAAKPAFNDDGSQLIVSALYWPGIVRITTLQAYNSHQQVIGYLGLGDSYSSGEGEVDDNHYLLGTNDHYEKCHTSDRSYIYLVAAIDGAQGVHNVACSGARITDIESSLDGYTGQSKRLGSGGLQLTPGQIINRQLAALTDFLPGEVPQAYFVDRYHPTVITVGVGGNDAGFMDKMRACMMPDECEWVTAEGRAQSKQEIGALQPKLVALYQDLQRRSPTSHIYAVGYPQIIQPDGACDGVTSLMFGSAERQFVSESIHYIDQVVAAAAASAGIPYLNVENALGDHKLCGGSNQLAVNELQLGDDVAPVGVLASTTVFGDETFHPTPLGHQLIAAAIHQQVGTLAQTNEPCTDQNCAVPPQPPQDWAGDPTTQAVAAQLTADEVPTHTQVLTISLYQNELQPHSVARVEIHSTPTQLGLLTVGTDGSLTGDVSLPTDLPSGYHTLHIYGVSYTGQPVDYYQTLLVKDLPAVPKSVFARAPLTGSGDAPMRQVVKKDSPAFVAPTAGVKGASSTVRRADTPMATHTWWKVAALALLIVAMTTTIVLLSRSATVPYDDE